MEFCGILTAINQIIIGYPLETLKIRSQARQWHLSTVLKNLSNEKGIVGLYRGCTLPSMVQTFVQPVHIMCFHHLYYQYEFSAWTSGLLSGALLGGITNPFETLKSRTQNGILNVPSIRYLCYQGLFYNVLRESIGTGTYWYVYYMFHHEWNPFYGGIAGVCSWIISYPFDVWKTRTQCGLSVKSAFHYGLSITLFRAFIVNTVNLSLYNYFDQSSSKSSMTSS